MGYGFPSPQDIEEAEQEERRQREAERARLDAVVPRVPSSPPKDYGSIQKNPTEGETFGGHVGNLANSTVKGAMGMVQGGVGLASLATAGMAGKAVDGFGYLVNKGIESLVNKATGLDKYYDTEFSREDFNKNGRFFKNAQDAADNLYTDQHKAKQQAFANAEGLSGKFRAALENPSLIANTVAESLPMMLGGGAISRGLGFASKALAKRAALTGALGEGAMEAGSSAEQFREASKNGLLSARDTALALASGAGTAAFGFMGGKTAQKLGIGDAETLMAQGAARLGRGVKDGYLKTAAKGAFSEGVLCSAALYLDDKSVIFAA